MVVVIADTRLITSDRSLRLNAPQQPGPGKGGQHVVDGLVADLGQLLTNEVDDRVGVSVGMTVHRSEHRDPRAGDPKIMGAQELLHYEQAYPLSLISQVVSAWECARA